MTQLQLGFTGENHELQRRRRLQKLLTRRDQLAMAAAIFEAHQFADPDEVRDAQYNIEAQIETEYHETHARLSPGWADRDAALVHDEQTPVEPCVVCRRSRASQNPAAPAPEAA